MLNDGAKGRWLATYVSFSSANGRRILPKTYQIGH